MEGVTVLSTITSTIYETGFVWGTLTTIAIIIALIGIAILILTAIFDPIEDELLYAGGCILIIIGVTMFFMASITDVVDQTFEVEKVVISDGINFNDFMDKYQIISREGNIYEVREWDPTSNPRPESENYTQTENTE